MSEEKEIADLEEVIETFPIPPSFAIDIQLQILATLSDYTPAVGYESYDEEFIKVHSSAMKIIKKAQDMIFKELRETKQA